MNYQKLASLLKAAAEPNRLQILEIPFCGEMCACDILKNFDFTQPIFSRHMKILEKKELVYVTKKGR